MFSSLDIKMNSLKPGQSGWKWAIHQSKGATINKLTLTSWAPLNHFVVFEYMQIACSPGACEVKASLPSELYSWMANRNINIIQIFQMSVHIVPTHTFDATSLLSGSLASTNMLKPCPDGIKPPVRVSYSSTFNQTGNKRLSLKYGQVNNWLCEWKANIRNRGLPSQ